MSQPESKRIDINIEAPLDAHGLKIFEQYREEIRLLSTDDIALLIAHMHLATENLISIIKDQEKKLIVGKAIRKVYGPTLNGEAGASN